MRDVVDRMTEQWAAQRPDLPVGVIGVVARVRHLARHFEREADRALEPYELAPWEWEILAALRRQGSPPAASPGRLARATGLSSGSVTHRVDRLVARGWVERRPDPEDRRGVRVVLTRRGRALVDRAVDARFEAARAHLDHLSARDLERLGGLLRQLLATYDPEPGEG